MQGNHDCIFREKGRIMRVILVTHGKVNPQGHNGISRVVYYLNKYEKQIGIQSEIWSVVDGVKKEELFERSSEVTVNCFPRIKLWKGKKNDFCKRILQEKDSIDLVHFHMPWLMDKLTIAKACDAAGIPYIVTGHSAYSGSQKQSWKMKLGKKYELPFLNRAKAVHAITREESTEFRKFGIHTGLFVIPNSIEDIERTKPYEVSKDGKIRILFMGELRAQKNIDGLIRAVSLLEEEKRAAVLFQIIGPDSRGNMEKLKKLANDLKVSECFEFLGGVFGEERKQYFENADLYITPSLSEVVSLSAIEAMAYGIPQIATRQADFSYLYREDFFAMCENYPQDMARAIEEMLDRKEEFPALSANARKAYEKFFTWDKNVKKFEKEYQRIIEQ